MQTRTLPHTELTVSRACFGVMTFGSQTGETEARIMVDACLDRGVNFFDTANVYNAGMSETILGKILKGRRDQAVVATKVCFKMGDAPDDRGLSRAAIRKAIDASLKRLDMDYVDVYYLHKPDPKTPIEETMETLNELVQAGKIRYPACSNYAAWQIVEMIAMADRCGYRAPYISQIMYNLLARGIEQEYQQMCRRFGVSTMVYNPLAGGLLTGKQQRERPLPGTRFDNNQLYLDRYWHPAYFDAVEELQAVAARAGRTVVDVAISWLLHHTPIDCVVLGASKFDHLVQNLDAVEKGPLPADVVAACDEVWLKLRGITPNYNRWS